MSDTSSPGEAPATPPAAGSAPSASPPAGDGADPFADLPDQPIFDRGWVQKIQNEGRRYREQAHEATESLKRYEDTFAGYGPEDLDVWFEMANTWRDDPRASAEMMLEIGQNTLRELGVLPASDGDATRPQAVTGTPEPSAEPDEKLPAGVTPEMIQEMIQAGIEQYAQQIREDREVENIFTQMRELGYEPETREGLNLLRAANEVPDFDLKAAHEMLQADRQKIIDDYVAGRTGGSHAQTAPNAGVVANTEQPIKNLDDARKATEAFLQSQRNAM